MFWIEDTGELCAASSAIHDVKVPGSLGLWGTGAASLTDVEDEDLSIEVLGNVATEEDARRLVAEVQGSSDIPGVESLRQLSN